MRVSLPQCLPRGGRISTLLTTSAAYLIVMFTSLSVTAGPINPLAPIETFATARATDGELVESESNTSLVLNALGLPSASADAVLFPGFKNQLFESASAHAEASGGGDPTVLATVTASNSNDFGLVLGGASAEASLTFQLMVVPLSDAPGEIFGVPIDYEQSFQLLGSSPAQGDNSSYGTAEYSYSIVDAPIEYVALARSTVDGPGIVNVSAQNFVVNDPYVVTLDVTASVHGNGSVSAGIDPTFTIDPTFAYANDYQIIYSPDLFAPDGTTGSGSGPSSLPEPSPWSALVGGLIACGMIRCRRLLKEGSS